jgi:hypothetical protein
VGQQPEPTEFDTSQGLVDHLHGCPLRSLMKFHIRLRASSSASHNVSGALAVVQELVTPRRHRLDMRWPREVSLLDDFRRDHPCDKDFNPVHPHTYTA